MAVATTVGDKVGQLASLLMRHDVEHTLSPHLTLASQLISTPGEQQSTKKRVIAIFFADVFCLLVCFTFSKSPEEEDYPEP